MMHVLALAILPGALIPELRQVLILGSTRKGFHGRPCDS